MAAANARGVVCVHDFQRSGGRAVWQRLDADRRLRLRVVMSFPLDMLPAARDLELRAGFGSRMLAVGPCKAFMDGTLGSRTAWMLDGSGDRLLSSDELAEGVREAAALGVPVAVHAIGDGANRAALDAFERTRDVWEAAALRPRIEHAQCVDDADLPRFAGIGVIASMQPAMIHSDRDVADERWGERAGGAYRVRDLLDSGAHVIFGDDAPIEPLDPLRGIAAAVHRTLDEREAWHADQRISVADAVMCTDGGRRVRRRRRAPPRLPAAWPGRRPGRPRHRHRRPPGADRRRRGGRDDGRRTLGARRAALVKKRGQTATSDLLQEREGDAVQQAGLVDEHAVRPAVQRHEVARVSKRELAPDAVAMPEPDHVEPQLLEVPDVLGPHHARPTSP